MVRISRLVSRFYKFEMLYMKNHIKTHRSHFTSHSNKKKIYSRYMFVEWLYIYPRYKHKKLRKYPLHVSENGEWHE